MIDTCSNCGASIESTPDLAAARRIHATLDRLYASTEEMLSSTSPSPKWRDFAKTIHSTIEEIRSDVRRTPTSERRALTLSPQERSWAQSAVIEGTQRINEALYQTGPSPTYLSEGDYQALVFLIDQFALQMQDRAESVATFVRLLDSDPPPVLSD